MDNILQKQYDISAGKIFSAFLIFHSLNVVGQTVWSTLSFSAYFTYIAAAGFWIVLIKNINTVRYAVNEIVIGEVILLMLILFTILRYDGYTLSIFNRCAWTIVFCVPLFGIFRKTADIKLALKETKIAVFIVMVLMLYMIIASGEASSVYNMALGYTLLYPTVFCLMNIKKHKLYILPSIVGGVVILAFGSRGPLLCIAVFLMFYLWFGIANSTANITIIRIVLIFSLLALIVFYKDILLMLSSVLENSGISGRTIRILLEGNILGDSGRSIIHQETLLHINEKPIIGWGIGGDIICMEMYPHLIFLEILLDFGYLIGGIICAIIVYSILKTLRVYRFRNMEYILLLSCGLVPLLISHSYLQEPLFWVLMGVSGGKARVIFEQDSV